MAGKFVAVCGRLSGEGPRRGFGIGASVDLNTHHPVGKRAVFRAGQAPIRSGRDTLKVTVAQDDCRTWTDDASAPVS